MRLIYGVWIRAYGALRRLDCVEVLLFIGFDAPSMLVRLIGIRVFVANVVCWCVESIVAFPWLAELNLIGRSLICGSFVGVSRS